jgi:hypothetical protein
MPVKEEESNAIEEIINAFERGYDRGLEENRRIEEALDGGPDSVYPPPMRVGGWVSVNPHIFAGKLDPPPDRSQGDG